MKIVAFTSIVQYSPDKTKCLVEISENEAYHLFPKEVHKAIEDRKINSEHNLEKHFEEKADQRNKAYALKNLVESLDRAIQLVIPKDEQQEEAK